MRSAESTNAPVIAGHDRSGSGVVAGRMNSIFVARGTADAVPIWFVTAATYADVRARLDAEARDFADAAGFEPKAGRHLLLPGQGGLGGVLFGIEATDDVKDLFLPGRLPQLLPDGVYRFANEPHNARLAALAVALGSYRFTRYRKSEGHQVKLELSQSLDRNELDHIAEAVTLARDLINTPANDMGPADLEAAARTLAAGHNAEIRAIVGDDLLAQNFPLIHAVGRAAAASAAPRLIDMVWGDSNHPRVTLVGKGVCFDTGGLDIKPESGMLNMKKDMGGAATALALAHMIMARGLKVRLRVLIPAVENSIAAASFRPRDIYTSRKGITVEIGNTDAEGRLILADALALADEENPALIADFATLTGAARVALGPDVPAFFTDDDALAGELMNCASSENDPLWRLPLWRPYEAMLESKVADINNVGGSQGGAITAALFMRRFVTAKSWLHFDLFAWSATAKPGRPEGGDCQVARALYALLAARYG
jgi:leucyl aminopeptidase